MRQEIALAVIALFAMLVLGCTQQLAAREKGAPSQSTGAAAEPATAATEASTVADTMDKDLLGLDSLDKEMGLDEVDLLERDLSFKLD